MKARFRTNGTAPSSKRGGGVLLADATSKSYTVPTSQEGTTYYYVVVTNTLESATQNKTASTTSSVAKVTVAAQQVTNAAAPTITTQPQDATVQKDATHALTVVATCSDSGTLSYQWYKATSKTDTSGTAIANATSASYTVPTGTDGTYYYYVVVTNTNDSVNGQKTATTTSNTASIVVSSVPINNAATPQITTQPQDTTIIEQLSLTLSVTATTSDSGTLSYQWYLNSDDQTANGQAIVGATSASYNVPTTTPDTYYYYVVVTNTNDSVNGTKTASVTSDIVTVEVELLVHAATPQITTQPQDTTIIEQQSLTLSVAATTSDSGTLSYQWYQNLDDQTADGQAIVGATSASYNVPTTTPNTYYYYVVVTNTNNSVNGTKTASVTSNIVTVEVELLVHAQEPQITTQPQSVGLRSGSTGATHTLTVVASSPDEGTITYQWYSNTVASVNGGTAISGQTTASLNVPADTAGISYYYVVVTNTNNAVNGTKTATIKSSVAIVSVADYLITLDSMDNGTLLLDRAAASQGDTVTITIAPDIGYRLVANSITVSDSSTVTKVNETTYSFQMADEDVSISAQFELRPYIVTIDTPAHGTLAVDKTIAVMGETLTITVTAPTGYTVFAVTVGGAAATKQTETEYTFTMVPSDVLVAVTFELIPYDVTIDSLENGTLTISSDTATMGSEVTITVSPDTGYMLVENSITVSGVATITKVNDTTYKFTMPASHVEISAQFDLRPYQITLNQATGGTLSTTSDTAFMGDWVTITVTPEEGYQIAWVKVNGEIIYGYDEYTFEFQMTAQDAVITAEYEARRYQIQVAEFSTGTIVTFASSAATGETVTFMLWVSMSSVYVEDSLRITSSSGDVSFEELGNNFYSFEMPADDVYIYAEFNYIQFEVMDISNSENGYISSIRYVSYNDSVILFITPNFGYEYVQDSLRITCDGQEIGYSLVDGYFTNTVYRFYMPLGDVQLYCEFQQSNLYQVTITEYVIGTVSSNYEKAPEGTIVYLTATPEDGYIVDYANSSVITDSCVTIEFALNVGYFTRYSFIMPGEAVTVDIKFVLNTLNEYKISFSYNTYYGTVSVPSSAIAGSEVEVIIEEALIPIASVKYRVNDTRFEIIANNGRYLFTMPSANIYVEVNFESDYNVYDVNIYYNEYGSERRSYNGYSSVRINFYNVDGPFYSAEVRKTGDPSVTVSFQYSFFDGGFIEFLMPRFDVNVYLTFGQPGEEITLTVQDAVENPDDPFTSLIPNALVIFPATMQIPAGYMIHTTIARPVLGYRVISCLLEVEGQGTFEIFQNGIFLPFRIPEANVNIVITLEEVGYHSITLQAGLEEHVRISVDYQDNTEYVTVGTRVFIFIEGFSAEVTNLCVNGVPIIKDGNYYFTMPAGDVHITANVRTRDLQVYEFIYEYQETYGFGSIIFDTTNLTFYWDEIDEELPLVQTGANVYEADLRALIEEDAYLIFTLSGDTLVMTLWYYDEDGNLPYDDDYKEYFTFVYSEEYQIYQSIPTTYYFWSKFSIMLDSDANELFVISSDNYDPEDLYIVGRFDYYVENGYMFLSSNIYFAAVLEIGTDSIIINYDIPVNYNRFNFDFHSESGWKYLSELDVCEFELVA